MGSGYMCTTMCGWSECGQVAGIEGEAAGAGGGGDGVGRCVQSDITL